MSLGKKLFCLAMAATLSLALALAAAAGQDPFVIKNPFKTAIVKYRMSGMQNGTSQLYIKGRTQARHVNAATKVMGMTQQQKTIEIIMPTKMIKVDLIKRTAKATGNPAKYMADEYRKLSPAEKKQVEKNAKEMGASLMSSMGTGGQGGQMKVRKGVFMGHKVKITTLMGFTNYAIENSTVSLKSTGSIMGMRQDTVATSVKLNAPVSDANISVPPGIKVVFDRQADQMMRKMAKRMIQNLKNPQAAQRPMMMPPAGQARAGSKPQAQPRAKSASASPKPAAKKRASDQTGVDRAMKKGLNALKGLFGN